MIETYTVVNAMQDMAKSSCEDIDTGDKRLNMLLRIVREKALTGKSSFAIGFKDGDESAFDKLRKLGYNVEHSKYIDKLVDISWDDTDKPLDKNGRVIDKADYVDYLGTTFVTKRIVKDVSTDEWLAYITRNQGTMNRLVPVSEIEVISEM